MIRFLGVLFLKCILLCSLHAVVWYIKVYIMDIIDVINKQRRLHKKSINDLAIVAGVTRGQMGKYLRGKNKIPYIVVEKVLRCMGEKLMVVLDIE